MNKERLMKMAGAVRTGGKGTMRRKKKAVHKTVTTDDKRLQATLKRVGVNTIPAIEEVNIFKDDLVIQFVNPKVQASIAANTWVVSGAPQTKSMTCLLAHPFNSHKIYAFFRLLSLLVLLAFAQLPISPLGESCVTNE
ncbi:hypothetical protein GUJ93_ZPchr0226g7149 [Zizania palustris]|uniref:Nascent polypeptide-associated complex subunit beta n=1 Tax=Zizania palustris TaxID=103762 RepID=A0A8J5UV92_ZIZPA|nr:hypothetical protein GUJ93_ZPchr0226g7149 [Zizania palustris]